MEVVAVTGGTGFIGSRLVELLAARAETEIRLLVRQASARSRPENVLPVAGDAVESASLRRLLVPGCMLINLVHLDARSRTDNTEFAKTVLSACAAASVTHLVHCSTATVVGRTPGDVINENTTCMPGNEYEATKLAVERVFLEQGPQNLGVSILRPTAVFGPGGKNLIKLADDLFRQSRILNYAKSSLYGNRRMNLVHVDNVAAALAFLADRQHQIRKRIYLVSDDEHSSNNYRDVEKRLMKAFCVPDYPIPPLPMPRFVLAAAMRIAGRSNTNPDRVYDSAKLRNAGLKKPMPFEEGLEDFIRWYLRRP